MFDFERYEIKVTSERLTLGDLIALDAEGGLRGIRDLAAKYLWDKKEAKYVPDGDARLLLNELPRKQIAQLSKALTEGVLAVMKADTPPLSESD